VRNIRHAVGLQNELFCCVYADDIWYMKAMGSRAWAGGFAVKCYNSHMPGGLRRAGSSDVAPSTSTGSLTSDFSGSRIRASVCHASSHGPPPISTAAAAIRSSSVTNGTSTHLLRTRQAICMLRKRWAGRPDDEVASSRGVSSRTPSLPRRQTRRRTPPKKLHAAPHISNHSFFVCESLHQVDTPCHNLSRQRGARPSSAVGARSGVPLLLHVASTAASKLSDLPVTFHLHVLAALVCSSAEHGGSSNGNDLHL
jgi:hypothetical protein